MAGPVLPRLSMMPSSSRDQGILRWNKEIPMTVSAASSRATWEAPPVMSAPKTVTPITIRVISRMTGMKDISSPGCFIIVH